MKAELREFTLGGLRFKAEQCIHGVLVNPALPRMFDQTPNEHRPASHRKWWHRPFIVTDTVEAMDAWPSGVRYTVRCLDGGAWDRSTNWGSVATLELALARARASGETAEETS